MQSATLETRKNENTINKKIYFVLYYSESSTAIIPPSYYVVMRVEWKCSKFFNGMTVSVVLRASFKKISENFNSNGCIERATLLKREEQSGFQQYNFLLHLQHNYHSSLNPLSCWHGSMNIYHCYSKSPLCEAQVIIPVAHQLKRSGPV